MASHEYLVVLSDDQHKPVDHTTAIPVVEDQARLAAARAFSRTAKSDPLRAHFVSGGLVFAWVWQPGAPTHPNGAPICVHCITLTRGAPQA